MLSLRGTIFLSTTEEKTMRSGMAWKVMCTNNKDLFSRSRSLDFYAAGGVEELRRSVAKDGDARNGYITLA